MTTMPAPGSLAHHVLCQHNPDQVATMLTAYSLQLRDRPASVATQLSFIGYLIAELEFNAPEKGLVAEAAKTLATVVEERMRFELQALAGPAGHA